MISPTGLQYWQFMLCFHMSEVLVITEWTMKTPFCNCFITMESVWSRTGPKTLYCCCVCSWYMVSPFFRSLLTSAIQPDIIYPNFCGTLGFCLHPQSKICEAQSLSLSLTTVFCTLYCLTLKTFQNLHAGSLRTDQSSTMRLMEPTLAFLPPHSLNLLYSPGLIRYILPR